MSFFPPEQLQTRRIEIDTDAVTCDSEAVRKRLNRIEANYQRLDVELEQLEEKMRQDPRLASIDDPDTDFESEFGVRRKRKWHSNRRTNGKKRVRKKSADPRKPR